ncbi:MAG TPA: hypothetical protein VGG65_10420 [Thermoanaerobaculia bacterium]
MRTGRRKAFLTGFVVAGILAPAPACKDSSNMVTSPSVVAAASVTGTWTGTFRSDNTMACASAPATLTLQQTGANVTGTISTSSCGPNGTFKGTVQGTQLMGSVEMLGCSGGAVNGMISGSGMSVTVGDLYRPIVTGNQVVASGGGASLSR